MASFERLPTKQKCIVLTKEMPLHIARQKKSYMMLFKNLVVIRGSILMRMLIISVCANLTSTVTTLKKSYRGKKNPTKVQSPALNCVATMSYLIVFVVFIVISDVPSVV